VLELRRDRRRHVPAPPRAGCTAHALTPHTPRQYTAQPSRHSHRSVLLERSEGPGGPAPGGRSSNRSLSTCGHPAPDRACPRTTRRRRYADSPGGPWPCRLDPAARLCHGAHRCGAGGGPGRHTGDNGSRSARSPTARVTPRRIQRATQPWPCCARRPRAGRPPPAAARGGPCGRLGSNITIHGAKAHVPALSRALTTRTSESLFDGELKGPRRLSTGGGAGA
jgi:hypothetical protein